MSRKQIGDIVVAWHRDNFGRDNRQTLAARARLKRCRSPLESLLHRETQDLGRRLRAAGTQASAEQLLILTSVMSKIRDANGARSIAAIFGFRPDRESPPHLSEIRFRSLVGARSGRELAARLVRFLDALGQSPRCDGRRLAEDLFHWNDRIRDAWCLQYYGVDPSTPQVWELPR